MAVLLTMLLSGSVSPCDAAVPPGETLLPPTPRGYCSTPSYPCLLEARRQISVGKLMDDPALKPFRDAAQAQLDKGEVVARIFLGLTPEELGDVAAGSGSVGLIQNGQAAPVLVLITDVEGKTAAADKVLDNTGKRLVAQGSTRAVLPVAGENAAA
jgi:hypothetical protein